MQGCAPSAAPCTSTFSRGRRRRRAAVCPAASSDAGSLDGWIGRWRARVEANEPPPRALRVGPDPRTGFSYLFAGGVSTEAQSLAALLLRDALEPRGVQLHVPNPQDAAHWSLSAAYAAFAAAADAQRAPLRLIGASVGALVCCLYAAEHPQRVDSLFLLSPPFDFAACLARAVGGDRGVAAWRGVGSAKLDGVPLPFAALADAAEHPSFPHVACRAFVVHGTEDGFARMEDSLRWVHGAGRVLGAERRLLEVADTHDLAASFGILAPKLLSWHGLEGVDALPPSIDLEESSVPLRDAAQGHGVNFTRYNEWLRAQGLDPDDLK